MCAPIKLNFLFCNRKLLFDALSNVYQADLWSVRGIPEADPGEGLRGLQPPPFEEHLSLVIVLFFLN